MQKVGKTISKKFFKYIFVEKGLKIISTIHYNMDTQNYFNIALWIFSDLYECIKKDENRTKTIKSKEITTVMVQHF